MLSLTPACRKEELRQKGTTALDTTTGGAMFVDITKAAGITWTHMNGGHGRRLMPETKGAGCAFIDFDNDGWPDLILVQGRRWPGHITQPEPTLALYRNNHDGTFTDRTAAAGLAIPAAGMGVAVADYDNDGWEDLLLTTYGTNHLFHNNHGVFEDVSHAAGLDRDTGWHSSAMWIDYDNDGRLDLFVGGYIDWTPENDVYCSLDGRVKAYCSPSFWKGHPNRLYHNDGNGTFTDATERAGLLSPRTKTLGVSMIDYNGDGWMDIVVANDLMPNMLYRNNGNGTFTDVGAVVGLAFGEDGTARAGMGIDVEDADNDGRQTIMIGNFAGEQTWVFKQTPGGTFLDCASSCGVGPASFEPLTFGLMLLDADLDGRVDMVCANGHIQPDIGLVKAQIKYRQTPQLYRNIGGGQYREVGQTVGGGFSKEVVGRGLAVADIDHDGDPDVLISCNNEAPLLLRNDRANANHFLRVRLRGTRSNAEGIGATIVARVDTTRMSRVVKSGSSFMSASEPVVTLGLGAKSSVDELVVRWNRGTVDTLRGIAANQEIVVIEGEHRYEQRWSSTPAP